MSSKAEKIKELLKSDKNKGILCGIVIVILAIIIAIIGIQIHNYRKVEPIKVETLQFSDYAENKDIKLIAHRGYRAIAPENTLPAYELAGQAGYWGAECDIYRTKDGVWVLHHDEKTFRLMNKSKKIESSSFEELQKLYYENGNNIQNYYELRICTLDEYLAKCEEFNMNPVIELKGAKNTEHYNEIVDNVKQYKVKPIYISFEKKALESMRKLTDDKMFLLTTKLSEKKIKQAVEIGNCGIEFDANEEKNFKDDCKLIKQAQKAELDTAAWNVNTIDTVGTLFNCNTYYYTTDCLTY